MPSSTGGETPNTIDWNEIKTEKKRVNETMANYIIYRYAVNRRRHLDSRQAMHSNEFIRIIQYFVIQPFAFNCKLTSTICSVNFHSFWNWIPGKSIIYLNFELNKKKISKVVMAKPQANRLYDNSKVHLPRATWKLRLIWRRWRFNQLINKLNCSSRTNLIHRFWCGDSCMN